MKYYVVWNGVNPGIYDTWVDCLLQVKGYPNARYKAFDSLDDARKAFEGAVPWTVHREIKAVMHSLGANASHPRKKTFPRDLRGLAVDAACSGNPGRMEYRGVWLGSNELCFHKGPIERGTNNIGEFLAICRGLVEMKRLGLDLPIYSDSQNAILWVARKACKTTLDDTEEHREVFRMIRAAEAWLRDNTYSNPILKWKTDEWGEIPADFGRK